MARKPQVEQTKIAELTPDPQNANLGTERGLRALDDSLASVGLGRSVVTDKHGRIIAGNKTVERATDRGFEDAIVVHTDGKQLVVVQRDDLDLAEGGKARELAYYDNRVAELDLSWKPEQLQADKDAGVEIVDKLWHPVELDKLGVSNGEQADDPGAQVDRAAELQEKWQVVRGDVWQIGRHKVMCGDSTCAEDVAKLMDGVKAGMVFTDPPYNGSLGRDGFANDPMRRKSVNKNKENIKGLYNFDPSSVLRMCENVTNGISSWFFFCNKNLVPNYINYALDNGKLFDILLWHKPDFIPMANNHYYPDTEYLIKVKSRGSTFNAGIGKDVASYGTYWVIAVKKGDNREAAHPTIKPTEIIKNQLLICSLDNQIILDPFLGSGTTVVACEQTGRVGYGMEIAPEYVAVCLERLAGMGLTPERTAHA